MNTSSPKQMAVTVALLSSSVSGIIFLFTNLMFGKHFWILLVVSVGSVFIIVYFLVYFLLRRFIFKKINPIYKAIHKKNIPEDVLRKTLENKDMLSEVKNEVMDWAVNRSKEIDQMKSLENYRKEFIGNVSHELKTPIFNIQGYVLTLLDGGLDDKSINRLYLERTEKSINRLISIVEDLESISRLESGELKLDFEDFNIVQLFEDVYEMQDMRANKHNITLTFDRKYDKPIWVKADKLRIIEVVNNLIVNSIKYGNKNGRTTVAFSEMGDRILVEVNDNGIGISEREIPRIFERFYRIDKSRSREQGGTGLGLSIVKHIIEAHNQTVNVRSTPGIGSSFAFTLQKGNK